MVKKIRIAIEPKYKKSIIESNIFHKEVRGNTYVATLETNWRGGKFYADVTQKELWNLVNNKDDQPIVISSFENFELDSTWDGCWCEWNFSDNTPEELQTKVRSIWEEHGEYPDDWSEEEEQWGPMDTEYHIIGKVEVDEQPN